MPIAIRARDHLSSIVLWIALIAAFAWFSASPAFGQGESASVSGRVTDQSSAVVPGVEVELKNVDTSVSAATQTNGEGYYVFQFVKPGNYLMTIRKQSFRTVSVTGIVLNVQENLSRNFVLQVGSSAESVTVNGNEINVNTTDASVSTVVDRTFVANTPLNGRSFQSLILLTPGSVTNTPQAPSNLGVSGEFSINGQRTESNYYSVDGVSANNGATSLIAGGAVSGSLPASTALGTTQGLVSAEALQEFRVESSTYSAEFGRNPGGQFSMVTRSGTNDWHGSVFEYFRNDVLDANSWFNNATDPRTPRGAERQNDFGGTIGGPLTIPRLYDGKDKTFFFFSYEGLRLVQPQDVSVNYVPDAALRQSAPAPLNAVLNAFPQPTPGAPDLGNGLAEYIGGWSNPSQLDSISLRLDQAIGSMNRAFFRFSDTPSSSSTRGSSAITATSVGLSSPSVVTKTTFGGQNYTGGLTTVFGPRLSNEFRINYSNISTSSLSTLDNFGGAVPVSLLQLQGVSPTTSTYNLLTSLDIGNYGPGLNEAKGTGTQQQWNVVDTVGIAVGKHQLKIGFDWRRLSPTVAPGTALAYYAYFSEASVLANSVDLGYGASQKAYFPVYRNFSLFAQDEWRPASRLSVSLGLRWEINPAPGVSSGSLPFTVTGLNDLSELQLAPQGTPLWKTSWYNIAPRLGLAYRLRTANGWETVLRSGGGVFFDTGQQTGSYGFNGPGFAAFNYFGNLFGVPTTFPTPPSEVTPPIVNPPVPPYGLVYANPPHLQLPYSIQWNTSIEQTLGASQSLTISYVGAAGRKLLEQQAISAGSYNPDFSTLYVYSNGLTSSYNSLQVKFQRRIAKGLQALGSYTLAHAIDFGSYNAALPYERGNSDLDVRNNFTGAVSYDLPGPEASALARALLRNWGVDARVTARSGFPVTLDGNIVVDPATGQIYYSGLNVVPGQPVYISGTQYPGGRSINPAAFALPNPGQFGDAPRNFVRGFGAFQTDFAVRREFPLTERLHGQFRVEAFNLFNHPIFGGINPFFGDPQFGQATSTLSQSLGVLNPLYQTGGPRSLQLALRLTF